MGTQKSIDIQMGLSNEDVVEPMIQKYFNESIINTKITRGKYCAYDYETSDRKTRFELKTRRVHHQTYPTILIGKNKIIKGCTDGAQLILLFLFTDGLFYIKYDPLTFGNFNEGPFTRYRDGNAEHQYVVHIPVNELTKIKF